MSTHVEADLPAYVNGTLPARRRAAVEAHLAGCSACRREAEEWREIAGGVVAATAMDAPRPDVGHSALERRRGSASGLWQLAAAQVRVVPAGVWALSAAAVSTALLLAFALPHAAAGTLLGMIVSATGGVGVAFSCGVDAEPCPDLCLSLPVPPRIVLALRLAMLFSFDAALGFAASLVLAAAHGFGGLWAISGLWLGPMLALGGLSAALAAVWGTAAAASGALTAWAARLFGGSAAAALWHTSAPVLVCAGALLALGIGWRPRLPRAVG